MLSWCVLQVYIVTGGRTDSDYISSTELLTPGTSAWQQTGHLPSPRRNLRGVSIGGNFLVTGEQWPDGVVIVSVQCCVTTHIQVDMAAATSLRWSSMMPPQETGSRPETSRQQEAAMVYPLLIGMMYQHSVNNNIHRNCICWNNYNWLFAISHLIQ